MSRTEGASNTNPELNPIDTGADVNVDKKPENESAPEKIEDGQGTEKPELPPEEQLINIDDGIRAKQQEIKKLTDLTEGTKAELDEARKKLELPPTEEETPNALSYKKKLEKLQAEQKILEKQKEELIKKQEKEHLIKEEKENILQEKLDELFKEFRALSSHDFKSILKIGKTREGRNIESGAMGELDPETAMSLARAFEEGIKLLPEILKNLPELLKKFDEDLTKEATKRVEKKLGEEKQEKGEEQKKEEVKPEKPSAEEKSEIPGDKISPKRIEQKPSVAESGNTETPKT